MHYERWLARRLTAYRLTLSARDFDDPSYPYYAEVNLQQLFGWEWCFPTLRGTCTDFGALIEVVPISEGLRYYAFVSTTDNVTNHVAIYLPR
jgi:hypothetical protein